MTADSDATSPEVRSLNPPTLPADVEAHREARRERKAAALAAEPSALNVEHRKWDERARWAVLWLVSLIDDGRIDDLDPQDEYVTWAREAAEYARRDR